jgi:hypothetical protein
MELPDPQLGLVISYSFLWYDEHRKGIDEGRKDRPCVIVVSTRVDESGDTIVRVAPVTHSPPSDPNLAIEIPAAVKRHLGLDDARSWVILNEYNEFTWPGYDLRPIPRSANRIDYGFLPPRLFAELRSKAVALWRSGHRKPTPRD